ncbi:acyl-CoA hydrolase [Bacillus sp. FJAT-27916]|uniref:acyl-CoA thioesterase n=1 Tax=Bacillaceae TaxID=186817 RepID=UPI0006714B89|nr:acyl-CoA thioesterase [Bacillus sp. FJAT-27916]KMY44402.1 acyl-CoA hydrolase [Bacillus sp. FJAT-27916]
MHNEAKKVKDSLTYLTDLILPADTNHYGTVFGGKVMAYVDKIAGIAAMRHCRKPVVTASGDSLDFHAPIKSGEAINLEAFVTWAHKTSMVVYVRVEGENLMTGERRLTSEAYLTMIAVDEDGRPSPVPAVIPETDQEIKLYKRAEERYFERKNQLK